MKQGTEHFKGQQPNNGLLKKALGHAEEPDLSKLLSFFCQKRKHDPSTDKCARQCNYCKMKYPK